MTNVNRKKSIYAINRMELTELLTRAAIVPNPESRAEHIYREFFSSHPFGDGTRKISKRIMPVLEELLDLSLPLEVAEIETSPTDGSVKMAVRLLRDGLLVESVLVPERGRLTQCISTQVGCSQGCSFCHTGHMGLTRGLAVEEIVGQVALGELVRKTHPLLRSSVLSSYSRVSNVVYMGMGEPLDNLEAVIRSLEIFTDDKGFRLSPNKVTVSTVGLLPALNELIAKSKAAIALSLHSPFNEERSRLIAANKTNPLTDVLAAMRRASIEDGRQFMVQYLLLGGVNDSPAHAAQLVEVLAGIRAKVNLIPFNDHEGVRFRRPEVADVYSFQQILKQQKMVATVRLSKGRDIQAACGQLIART